MKNMENERKLYNSKKIFLMVTAILVGSIFGGYKAYNDLGDSVRAGLCVGVICFLTGMSIVLLVVYHGNKKGKD